MLVCLVVSEKLKLTYTHRKNFAVKCRKYLHQELAFLYFQDAYYFHGSENSSVLAMTGVKCTGEESALHLCKNDGKRLSECGHPGRRVLPYAGAICTECKFVSDF